MNQLSYLLKAELSIIVPMPRFQLLRDSEIWFGPSYTSCINELRISLILWLEVFKNVDRDLAIARSIWNTFWSSREIAKASKTMETQQKTPKRMNILSNDFLLDPKRHRFEYLTVFTFFHDFLFFKERGVGIKMLRRIPLLSAN